MRATRLTPLRTPPLVGAIAGKALYEGTLSHNIWAWRRRMYCSSASDGDASNARA
ncbi:MAG: hypothetical protein RMJ83_00095 [Armatimonadota bacterium]|nr:hypothetical protein [Armatimonadota bacterium]